ncbi:DUF2239 family protein [Asaia sp. As-1742]|uniref:DUF2239 family protein n=1 Tax=Asaia sp. As-1742 TaxID=2608325 RepID=UPI00141FE2BB|nr:DUF2239 family protein [Asaia sp. As-1742]NIE81586.1 DUF2239 family protein [Asaia sp. As-1742]
MSDHLTKPCTAFAGTQRIAQGSLVDVALGVKAEEPNRSDLPILVFDDETGAVIDLDLRGTTAEIVRRLADQAREATRSKRPQTAPKGEDEPRSRGRPRLGVVAREVTLLPRHWEWLGTQSGGASQALRRLIDEARRLDCGRTQRKAAREAAYRFLHAMAGDLPGFEEATRSLFAGNEQGFADRMASWPIDVRRYALKLAQPPTTTDLT